MVAATTKTTLKMTRRDDDVVVSDFVYPVKISRRIWTGWPDAGAVRDSCDLSLILAVIHSNYEFNDFIIMIEITVAEPNPLVGIASCLR